MKVIFLRPALRELHEAINYYELQVQGLGSRFKIEIDLARKRIAAYRSRGPSKRLTFESVSSISFRIKFFIPYTTTR